MNSKERVFKRIRGEKVDRVPNFNIVMGFAANHIGRSLRDYLIDYRILVEANIRSAEDFGIDLVQAISDPYRETEGFGVEIVFPENEQPHCKSLFIETPEDIKKLEVINPWSSVRMLDRIKAIELYKKELGGEYPILGWVEGSLAEACDLRGISNVMLDFYDEPEMIREVMDICLENAIGFARAQIEAGADIIGVGDAAASLLGPKIYREFVLEYEKKLFGAITAMGGVGRLHICGNTSALLEDARNSGANIIDIDWMVDFKLASEKLKGYASPCGNFDPVKVILQGDPSIVEKAVDHCIKSSGDTSIIMAGCEIPIGSPSENMKAVSRALKEYQY